MNTETIIITRHPALTEYIFERGIAPRGTLVIPHASEEHVRGRRCIGPLPLHFAALAASIVEIPLRIPAELRGIELTLKQVRAMASPPREYRVQSIELTARV